MKDYETNAIIRWYGLKPWGTIRAREKGDGKIDSTGLLTLCYDTQIMDSVRAVKKELSSFAKWKGLKIRKYIIEKRDIKTWR